MDPLFHALQLDISRTRAVLPPSLHALADLAWNLATGWLPGSRALFQEIDCGLWESSAGNARLTIERCGPRRLAELACDPEFLQRLDRLAADLRSLIGSGEGPGVSDPVAYFSAEFGLQESLPIYSGGLGVLAGDHLKAASDDAIPLVGIGLRYRQGYFRQRMDGSGWQVEEYPETEFSALPAGLLLQPDGTPRLVSVRLGHHVVHIQMWGVMVGRVPLLLLDTNREDNEPSLRDITSHLYGGGHDVRIAQEIVLGIGGIRALRSLGYRPRLFHMNEGHAAFMGLELLREHLDTGQAFEEAVAQVRSRSVFTTHTPVPAGHDVFDMSQARWALGDYVAQFPGGADRIWTLARRPGGSDADGFGMTPLAVHLSRSTNGVSKLHGEVCKPLLHPLWPEVAVQDVPVTSVTNGVHLPTWLAPAWQELFDRHLPADWRARQEDPAVWEGIDRIPDAELWDTHQRLKSRLLATVRERSQAGLAVSAADGGDVPARLDPGVLTLGFARRVATYKRLYMLLSDSERAAQLLGSLGRPVQILIAGKAHPRDVEAKHMLQGILRRARELHVGASAVFVVDYNMAVARELVQGCDVWLNLPRRPLEASGTSGMKAAANGVPNASILDGWWAEAYDGTNGWAIGTEEDYSDHGRQDAADSASLYHILEDDVVPLYYQTDGAGRSTGWLRKMRASIRTCAPQFSAQRMVRDYARDIYRL